MGVNVNTAVNFAAISNEMATAVAGWMNGSIQIIDPNTADQTWDPVTNEYTGGTADIIWSGPARIQHLTTNKLVDAGFVEIDVRKMRFQIPNDPELPFIRKGLQIIVTDGGSDSMLEQLSYVVTSAVNSSYAWLRTINAEVDMKSVAFQ